MAEAWVDVYGQIDVLISGVGLVHGELGDMINVPEERWHRATSRPGSGKSIRLSMISRSKEGQVLFYQADVKSGGLTRRPETKRAASRPPFFLLSHHKISSACRSV